MQPPRQPFLSFGGKENNTHARIFLIFQPLPRDIRLEQSTAILTFPLRPPRSPTVSRSSAHPFHEVSLNLFSAVPPPSASLQIDVANTVIASGGRKIHMAYAISLGTYATECDAPQMRNKTAFGPVLSSNLQIPYS